MWYSTACDAIEKGRCLELEYEIFTRLVEVHRVGVSPAGDHIMSGWQIRGLGNERVGWKLLSLDEPKSLKLTDIPSLAPRPDYRRGAKQSSELFVNFSALGLGPVNVRFGASAVICLRSANVRFAPGLDL